MQKKHQLLVVKNRNINYTVLRCMYLWIIFVENRANSSCLFVVISFILQFAADAMQSFTWRPRPDPVIFVLSMLQQMLKNIRC